MPSPPKTPTGKEKSAKSTTPRAKTLSDDEFMIEILRAINGQVNITQLAASCGHTNAKATANRFYKIKKSKNLEISAYFENAKDEKTISKTPAVESPVSKTTAVSSPKGRPGRKLRTRKTEIPTVDKEDPSNESPDIVPGEYAEKSENGNALRDDLPDAIKEEYFEI